MSNQKTRARVLNDHNYEGVVLPCGGVVACTKAQTETLTQLGVIDTHKDAVAAALDAGAEVLDLSAALKPQADDQDAEQDADA